MYVCVYIKSKLIVPAMKWDPEDNSARKNISLRAITATFQVTVRMKDKAIQVAVRLNLNIRNAETVF